MQTPRHSVARRPGAAIQSRPNSHPILKRGINTRRYLLVLVLHGQNVFPLLHQQILMILHLPPVLSNLNTGRSTHTRKLHAAGLGCCSWAVQRAAHGQTLSWDAFTAACIVATLSSACPHPNPTDALVALFIPFPIFVVKGVADASDKWQDVDRLLQIRRKLVHTISSSKKKMALQRRANSPAGSPELQPTIERAPWQSG